MILGALFAALLSITPEQPITPPAAAAQARPSVAADGAHDALAVWREGDLTRAVHLHDGAPDSEPVDVGPAAAQSYAAFDGGEYLVVMSDLLVRGRRLARDGTPIDLEPFDILNADAGTGVRVVFDGENFVIAATVGGDLVVTRVNHDGQLLDPTPLLVHHATSEEQMHGPSALASNGNGSIVVWNETPGSLWASVIGRSGIATGPIFIADLTWSPAIAWTGSNYVIAWLQPMGTKSLRWARVDAEGVLVGSPGELFLMDRYPFAAAAAAPLGDGALIAWQDYTARFSGLPSNTNIRGIRVGADGAMSGPFDVAASLSDEVNPSLGSADGVAQMVYERGQRVFTRRVQEVTPRRRAAR